MASLERQAFEDSARRPRLPPHDAKPFYALGIYIQKDLLSGVVVDVDGNVAKSVSGREGPARLTQELQATDVGSVVDGVAALVGRLSALHPDYEQLVGLGVTLSGQVDADNATVQWSHRMGWDGPVPLAELLEEKTGHPTVVEHDVKALALAEQWFGLGQGRRSFAVVTAGLGIGSALVIGYRLWRGLSGEAGELGHLALPLGRRRCLCGNWGCLETEAGGDGILLALREEGYTDVNHIDAASELARQGDQAALRAFEHAGEVLGRGLSWLVNLLNLELVIVRATPAMLTTGVYEQATRLHFEEHGFHDVAERCELRFLPRDQELGARSAGSMALQSLPDRLAEQGESI